MRTVQVQAGRRTLFPRRMARTVLAGLAALAALWAAGFAWFIATIPEFKAIPPGHHVGGIVVFTGSAGRIRAGVEALTSGFAERLLISGVNPDLTAEVLRSAITGDQALFDCCIELGRAQNTEANAAEAVAWAERHGLKSIALVTSDWHMRRSLVEFARLDHTLLIDPIPVESDAGFGRLALEYSKYVAAHLRAAVC